MNAVPAVLLCAGVLAAGIAHAGAVEVAADRCADTIHIKAQDAPVADVLAKVSDTLGFRVDAAVALTDKVTVDRKGPPERLLKNLLLGKNLVIQTGPSKACGGKERITTVWILPVGQDAPRHAASEPVQPQAQASAAVPPGGMSGRQERPRGTRKNMSEAEWQQMKKDYQAGKITADAETGQPVPVQPEAFRSEPAP